MRARIIGTGLVNDEWFLSLPIEEQRFFLQLLITPKGEMSGIFSYTDREILFDLPFFNSERLQIMKKKFESDKKVYFFEGWIWLAKFTKNNFFNSPQQKDGIINQLIWITNNYLEVLEHFKKKGFAMPDLTDYLQQKQRNRVKKEIKKVKPYLMGQALETEVEKIIGVVESGKMDWAALVDTVRSKEESKYPNAESVGYSQFSEIGKEFRVRPTIIYWYFSQKVDQLKSQGRTKYDYLSLARSIAAKALKKPELTQDEKRTAAIKYVKEVLKQEPTNRMIEDMVSHI